VQPQARGLRRNRAHAVDAVEALEDAREVGRRDADAAVGDADDGFRALAARRDLDPAVRPVVAHGVRDQVVEDLPEVAAVEAGLQQRRLVDPAIAKWRD
jgi:hypothetical protein